MQIKNVSVENSDATEMMIVEIGVTRTIVLHQEVVCLGNLSKFGISCSVGKMCTAFK